MAPKLWYCQVFFRALDDLYVAICLIQAKNAIVARLKLHRMYDESIWQNKVQVIIQAKTPHDPNINEEVAKLWYRPHVAKVGKIDLSYWLVGKPVQAPKSVDRPPVLLLEWNKNVT